MLAFRDFVHHSTAAFRFNGRISELCQQTRFASAAELEQTLKDYLLAYNHFIPQKAIGHRSPIDALASWYTQHPELFIMPVHNHTERDTYISQIYAALLFLPLMPLHHF